MADRPVSPVLRFLRALGPAGPDEEATDGQLLARFVRQRDEAAFVALFRRHGPMVWGVCRRALPDADTAEDAFQATFLVLLRKAGSVGRPESLASWLYAVACRTAARAKALRARRHAREGRRDAEPAAGATADPAWLDLRPLLDEELQALPPKYRAPLVLCYLEGKTYAEAARLLGWAEGTVSGRLARARDLLRGRLTRRGLALSAGCLATLLARDAPAAALPAGLAGSSLKAVLPAAAGGAAASPQVIALTKGVLRAMFLSQLKVAGTVLLAVTLLGAGAGFSHHVLAGGGAGPRAEAAPGPAVPLAPAAEEDKTADKKDEKAPRAKSPDGKLVAVGDDKSIKFLDADSGKELRTLAGHAEKVTALAFSPDGKALASGGADHSVRLWDVASGKEIRRMEGQDVIKSLTFSEDGKTLTAKEGEKGKRTWDLASGKEVKRP
jgi:RNA polymerase sigma factor (sigma-70 family)